MLKNILPKLNLIDSFSILLPISKNDFVNRLSEIVEEDDLGVFSDWNNAFSLTPGAAMYKGRVNFDGFTLQRKVSSFDQTGSLVRAKGTCEELNGQLLITAEVTGRIFYFIFYFITLIPFFLILILGLKFSQAEEFLFMGFFIVLILFLFANLYRATKRSIFSLKYDLEREFYYMTK